MAFWSNWFGGAKPPAASSRASFQDAGGGIVITTAQIPGRPAPKLITADMVASMKPGSVLVDLAVERGGNVEGVMSGEIAEVGGVKIVGFPNLAG